MHNSKKILFTTENISFGGSELLWTKTVLELSKFNFSIAVCVNAKLKLPKEIISLQEENKIKVIFDSNSTISVWKRLLNRFIPYIFRFKPTDNRLDFILNFKPDLIVMNQGFNFNAVPLMLFAQNNSFNYVTISHAVNESLWPNNILRENMKLSFRNSLKNYFVSQDNLAVTQNQLGYFLKNAEVVRNPFNLSYSINLEFPQSNDFSLACVGRYDFYAKGQDVLLQTLSSEKWKSRNLYINFYGEGADVDNLKEMVEMYKISNVTINSHTATDEIWKTNHGLILNSRFEGLPIVIVEAMLSRRFVIVTNVSGNKELVIDNETGFIAAAPRPEYIDDALERAWQNRESWKKIGEKARQEIVTHIPENPALDFANELQTIISNL